MRIRAHHNRNNHRDDDGGVITRTPVVRQRAKRAWVARRNKAANNDPDRNGDGGVITRTPAGGTATLTRPQTKKPDMYKVVMLNDDYTPMEFVVLVLQEFFRKSQEEATRIMLAVHQRGVGVCGVYTHEVAETKAGQVMALARKNQHPLQLQIEKE